MVTVSVLDGGMPLDQFAPLSQSPVFGFFQEFVVMTCQSSFTWINLGFGISKFDEGLAFCLFCVGRFNGVMVFLCDGSFSRISLAGRPIYDRIDLSP
jgi:hypothetical protein